METKPLRYFSHSRVDQDERCQRAGFLSREWGGTGLDPIHSGWDLLFGNLIHKYLYDLAKSGNIDFKAVREEIYTEGMKQLNQIQAEAFAASGEGLLRGFVRMVWPHWMKEYDVYSAEGIVSFEPYPGYVFRAIKDLILKSKVDGHLSYREYKTTSSNSSDWVASWSTHPQPHTSMYATMKAEKIEIRDCVVVGLYKGYRDKKLGVKRNIMNYGWVNREHPTTPVYRNKYTSAKGFEMFPTYHEWPSLEGWVKALPDEILSELYPQTGPIFLREDIAEAWFRQQQHRQFEIGAAMSDLALAKTPKEVEWIMDLTFPQKFTACNPAYGGIKCQYNPICWTPWIAEDPLGSGQFVRHENEIDADEEA